LQFLLRSELLADHWSGRRVCSRRCFGLRLVASRFSPRAAAFIVSLSIVWTTTFGIGYFGNPALSITERVPGGPSQHSTCGRLAHRFLPRLFAETREKRRLAEAALHASETQRYLIETQRLAALGRPRRGELHTRSTPRSAMSLTVASTLAHRSANFAGQIVSGPVRRSLPRRVC